MRRITQIILHCSATHPGQDIGAAEITAWHTDPNKKPQPFRTIGYHYVIRRSGLVENGRPISQVGAHCEGQNANSIGICIVGGVNRANAPDCNFTSKQWAALEDLVSELIDDYPEAQVTGHRAYSTKACPSFSAVDWWYGK